MELGRERDVSGCWVRKRRRKGEGGKGERYIRMCSFNLVDIQRNKKKQIRIRMKKSLKSKAKQAKKKKKNKSIAGLKKFIQFNFLSILFFFWP